MPTFVITRRNMTRHTAELYITAMMNGCDSFTGAYIADQETVYIVVQFPNWMDCSALYNVEEMEDRTIERIDCVSGFLLSDCLTKHATLCVQTDPVYFQSDTENETDSDEENDN